MWLLSKYEPSEALGHKYLSLTFSLLQVASLQSTIRTLALKNFRLYFLVYQMSLKHLFLSNDFKLSSILETLGFSPVIFRIVRLPFLPGQLLHVVPLAANLKDQHKSGTG